MTANRQVPTCYLNDLTMKRQDLKTHCCSRVWLLFPETRRSCLFIACSCIFAICACQL